MSWIIKYSRGCPHCSYAFQNEIFLPGFQFIGHRKYDFDSDHYELTEIDTREPLFYHPKTNVYLLGVKHDRELLEMQFTFLRRYDREMYLFIEDRLPYPEIPLITDRFVSGTDIFVFDTVYNRAHEVQLKRPHDYDVESKVLDRISKLLSEK